jgi:hypothetical protein
MGKKVSKEIAEVAGETLQAFDEYLRNRIMEFELTMKGNKLVSAEPYYLGLSQGMQTGLRMADDLLHSYLEWTKRGVYWPDRKT